MFGWCFFTCFSDAFPSKIPESLRVEKTSQSPMCAWSPRFFGEVFGEFFQKWAESRQELPTKKCQAGRKMTQKYLCNLLTSWIGSSKLLKECFSHRFVQIRIHSHDFRGKGSCNLELLQLFLRSRSQGGLFDPFEKGNSAWQNDLETEIRRHFWFTGDKWLTLCFPPQLLLDVLWKLEKNNPRILSFPISWSVAAKIGFFSFLSSSVL